MRTHSARLLGLILLALMAAGIFLDGRHASGAPAPAVAAAITADELTLIHQIGGDFRAVATQNNLVYAAIGTRLEIFDASDPAGPLPLGQLQLPGGGFPELSGDYLFAVNSFYLHTVDVSEPAVPQLAHSYALPGGLVYGAVLADNHIFIASAPRLWGSGGGGLRIINVSDPLNPQPAAVYADGDWIRTFTLGNEHVYASVCRTYGNGGCSMGTAIVNVADPANPIELSYNTYASWPDAWASRDTYLYSSLVTYGTIYIADISNPANPALVNSFTTSPVDHLKIVGDMLFTYRWLVSGLKAFALQDPEQPQLLGGYADSFYIGPYGVTADTEAGYAYLAYGAGGLRVLDLNEAGLPESGRYQTFGTVMSLLVVAPYVYLLEYERRLQVLDVTEPLAPAMVGVYTSTQVYLGSMARLDEDVIISGTSGFEILATDEPANPVLLGRYNRLSTQDIRVKAEHVFVTINNCSDPSVEVVTIANRTAPELVTTIGSTQHSARGMEVVGNYLFVNENSAVSGVSSRLTLLDISAPETPQIVATHMVPSSLGDLVVLNDHAYLINGEYGIRILDVSNPLAPAEAGFYPVEGAVPSTYSLRHENGRLYLEMSLQQGGTLRQVLDVSNPAEPVAIGSYDYLGALPVGDVLYAPAGTSGLSIYSAPPADEPPPASVDVYLPLVERP